MNMYYLLNYDMMDGNKENREKDEWDYISKVIFRKKLPLRQESLFGKCGLRKEIVKK